MRLELTETKLLKLTPPDNSKNPSSSEYLATILKAKSKKGGNVFSVVTSKSAERSPKVAPTLKPLK